MWENYELTPSPAGRGRKAAGRCARRKGAGENLRTQMRALGNVNLDAVEEYRQVLERYTFMGEQKDDLEKAQKELYTQRSTGST